jgi:hypothetical protein
MARAGLQGADQQKHQQQRTDQAQDDHQRSGEFGIGQDQRADHEHHDSAQANHAVIGQAASAIRNARPKVINQIPAGLVAGSLTVSAAKADALNAISSAAVQQRVFTSPSGSVVDGSIQFS